MRVFSCVDGYNKCMRGELPLSICAEVIGLPLLDLFINRQTELDYDLEEMKILYSNLNLPAPYDYNIS